MDRKGEEGTPIMIVILEKYKGTRYGIASSSVVHGCAHFPKFIDTDEHPNFV